MQARLIKGIQKPRPEFETVGACLIMLHGISDAGANFECWYVEFLPEVSSCVISCVQRAVACSEQLCEPAGSRHIKGAAA